MPIHDNVMKVLSYLTTDGTYSHNKVALASKSATSLGKDIFCYDLTSATDRFPVKLQEDVLRAMYGPEVASLWKHILIDRDFQAPTDQKNVTRTVRYAVGQPMGFLSS